MKPTCHKLIIPLLGLSLALTGCGGGDSGSDAVVAGGGAVNNGGDGGGNPAPQGQTRTFNYPDFPSDGQVTLVANYQPPGETSSVTADVVATVRQGAFAGLARMVLGKQASGTAGSTATQPPCGTADVATLTMLMGESAGHGVRLQTVSQGFQDLPEGELRDFFLITDFSSVEAAKVLQPEETEHCTIFAEVDEQGVPCLSRERALAIAEAFDSNNPARPGSGIYDQVRAVFGSEWNQNPPGGNDGDDKIVLFFFRPETLGENLYGYTSPIDQSPNESDLSNKSEIVYLNSGRQNEEVLSTLAHEFQHLINQNEKLVRQGSFPSGAVDENISLNEGLSGLAEEVCGYDLDNGNVFLANAINQYLSRPEDHEFFDFFAAGAGYGQTYLFFKYVREHFGDATIRAIVTSPNVGKANLDAQLSAGFGETFRRWTVANYATNLGGAVPAIYRYPSGFRTDGDYAAGDLTGPQTYPMANNRSNESGPLGAWSTIYLTYSGGDGSDLELSVQTAPGSPVGVVYEAFRGTFTSFQQ